MCRTGRFLGKFGGCTGYMMRRPPTFLIMLLMISLVLLPADSNIAANALPSGWQPYLWLAWPIGALLAAPLIIWEMRKTLREIRPSTGDTPERDADEMDGSRPSDAGMAVRRRGGLIGSLDRQFGFSRFD